MTSDLFGFDKPNCQAEPGRLTPRDVSRVTLDLLLRYDNQELALLSRDGEKPAQLGIHEFTLEHTGATRAVAVYGMRVTVPVVRVTLARELAKEKGLI